MDSGRSGFNLTIERFFPYPILAIETSCDETSAAVIQGVEVRSNVVSSQIKLHERWGGVVPEAAARAHVEAILPVIREALNAASLSQGDLGAIAATNRPGLVAALSVGLSAAKALAFRLKIPFLGIHHLEGHLLSVLSETSDLPFPFVSLIVSGGHTELVLLRDFGNYEIVGQTLDDAAGEAFDKGSRLLGLGYPGGKAIQDAAIGGNPLRYPLPKGLAGDTLDFSFSGLKTAVLRLVEKEGTALNVSDAAASLQNAVVSVLTERAVRAGERLGVQALSLVGGVAANVELRSRLAAACDRAGFLFLTPKLEFCTDNAAMIGLAASVRLAKGERSAWDLDCMPNCSL